MIKAPPIRSILNLDGTQHGKCGNFYNYERTSPFSWSAWVRPDASLSGFNTVIAKMVGVSNFRGYLIGLSATRKFSMTIRNNTGNFIARVNQTILPTTGWAHVVGSYDGTSLETGIIVYTNGDIGTQTSGGNPTITATCQTSEELRFGRTGTGPDDIDYFNGDLMNVAVWDRALTAAEALALYQGGRGRKAGQIVPSNFMGGWLFANSSQTATVPDYGVNDIDCTLVNSPSYTGFDRGDY